LGGGSHFSVRFVIALAFHHPHFAADVPKVMIERYGDPDKECLFTVRNETDKPVFDRHSKTRESFYVK